MTSCEFGGKEYDTIDKIWRIQEGTSGKFGRVEVETSGKFGVIQGGGTSGKFGKDTGVQFGGRNILTVRYCRLVVLPLLQ